MRSCSCYTSCRRSSIWRLDSSMACRASSCSMLLLLCRTESRGSERMAVAWPNPGRQRAVLARPSGAVTGRLACGDASVEDASGDSVDAEPLRPVDDRGDDGDDVDDNCRSARVLSSSNSDVTGLTAAAGLGSCHRFLLDRVDGGLFDQHISGAGHYVVRTCRRCEIWIEDGERGWWSDAAVGDKFKFGGRGHLSWADRDGNQPIGGGRIGTDGIEVEIDVIGASEELGVAAKTQAWNLGRVHLKGVVVGEDRLGAARPEVVVTYLEELSEGGEGAGEVAGTDEIEGWKAVDPGAFEVVDNESDVEGGPRDRLEAVGIRSTLVACTSGCSLENSMDQVPLPHPASIKRWSFFELQRTRLPEVRHLISKNGDEAWELAKDNVNKAFKPEGWRTFKSIKLRAMDSQDVALWLAFLHHNVSEIRLLSCELNLNRYDRDLFGRIPQAGNLF
ncbi:hypothetical protein B0T18DRAFT_487903 [Schizothecium vesticola]|uniref:Uncharacterized protein n=1 Tax=Schizothecium vesticola TaxID=314040 RepID=A0AA40F2Z0_9PEZI|nr:hypothetical protein B0T18DRAFT_487903 [Schizothecium vesticola]